MDRRPSTVKGQAVEVGICEPEVGFVLSVGPVSLWLEPAVAIDVLDTLARAVAAAHSQTGERSAPDPMAVLRRRIS